MQHVGNKGLENASAAKEPAEKPESSSNGVYSLAAARARRVARSAEERRDRMGVPAELRGIDLRGIDLERVSSPARERFWFEINRFTRNLYATATNLAITETNRPYSPITATQMRSAARQARLPEPAPAKPFGSAIALDALQIFGAALCGAFATKPEMLGDFGMVPLAVALCGTIGVFLAREILGQRS